MDAKILPSHGLPTQAPRNILVRCRLNKIALSKIQASQCFIIFMSPSTISQHCGRPIPKLSLTLNGRHGMVVARRYIAPQEYLPANMSEAAGINAGAMLEVELVLATAGEPARAYKLHLVP